MQHRLAMRIAGYLDSERVVECEERALLVFGIEVILNEFLKTVVIFVLATLMGQLPITFCATIYLLFLRKYAKGRHCNSNLKCYAVTIITIIILPVIFANISLPVEVSIAMILLVSVGFWIRLSDTFKTKVKLLLVYYIGLLGGYLLDQWEYVNALLIVALVVVVAIDTTK